MNHTELNANYWNERYLENQTGWDIRYPSPAFISFFKDKSLDSKILIPGCGNSYEGEALHNLGFKNIFLLDYASESKQNFLKRVPTFSATNFLVGNFFEHSGTEYDFILEQTFFCALHPSLRNQYVSKMKELLAPKGHLIGLLFDIPLVSDQPPFGGSLEEYTAIFSKKFNLVKITNCENSIVPRAGKEFWIEISNH